MSLSNQLNSSSECLSAQVFQPIYVPVICGNDVYIVAQQDIRHIIESRNISSVKCPNGFEDLQRFYAQINNQPVSENNPPLSYSDQLSRYLQYLDFVNRAVNLVQWQCPQNGYYGEMRALPLPIPTGENNIAPIQAQLDWEMKEASAEKPNQFTYGKQTSTTDLTNFRQTRGTCNLRPIIKILLSKGTNASASQILDELHEQITNTEDTIPTAQEQLKQKKTAGQQI